MMVLKKLHKQLRQEFPSMSPDLTTAVVEFISGGARDETYEQFCRRMLRHTKYDTQEERDEYLYRTLLKMGRQTCKNIELLNILKTVMSEAVTEVRQERVNRKKSHAVVTTGVEKDTQGLFNKHKKRKDRDVEHEPEDQTPYQRARTISGKH